VRQTIQKKIKKKNQFFFNFKKYIYIYRLCRRDYADGFALGIAYAEGKCYADGKTELRRGASTPRAALGVYYADGKTWLRRGQLAVGVSLYSCSAKCNI
jgi:hypothetical protein